MSQNYQPLVNENPQLIYPQVPVQPVAQNPVCANGCRCRIRERVRAFRKNHKKVLKISTIVHLVFSFLGLLFIPFHISILRIVTSVIGLRGLKKKSALLLVIFGAMMIQNIILTFFAPFVGSLSTIFAFGSKNHRALPLLFLVNVVAGIFMLICQFTCLIKTIKMYRQEKKKFAPSTTQEVELVQPEAPSSPLPQQPQVFPQVIPQVVPQQQTLYPVPSQMVESSIVTLPPPPQTPLVQEALQKPVVQVGKKYTEELKLLREMGFESDSKNIELLIKFNGNIQNCIQHYISTKQ